MEPPDPSETDSSANSESIDALLARGLENFGFSSFRPGQSEAIRELLEGGRLLLVAPTGGGKSLCYQLPATVLSGTTLVVSPLIALMHDQVRGLEALGVSATYLASTLSSAQIRQRMAKMAAGDYKLVYVAPERLTYPGFRALLQDCEIPLLAIDEAHCISEWGHDFRPEYMQIGELVAQLKGTRVLACTATATPVVRDEILLRLGLGSDTPQVLKGFARPNLSLSVAEYGARSERPGLVDAMLTKALGGPGRGRGSAIIYSPTRKFTDEECARLEAEGWTAGAYHAGLSSKCREQVQQRFSAGTMEIVVATNAFGMGIDRADVRAVIHLAPPGSIESYYQEVGRAGRDGDDAWGLLLTTAGDVPLRRRLLERENDGRAPDPEVVEHKWNLFLELMRWVEGGTCRHDGILRYFGDDAEILRGCGRCDLCLSLDDEGGEDIEVVSLLVRKALSGVARIHGRFGLGAAAVLLKGKADERLQRAGLDEVRTFGILAESSEEWILRLLRRCVTAGWVTFSSGDRPVVSLTREGKLVMAGELPVRMVLPPELRGKRKEGRAGSGAAGRSGARAQQEVVLDEAGMRLFERLRAFRLRESQEAGVPPYRVASDRTLRELVLLKPRTLQDLQLAHGIGPAKAEQYGEGFLAEISAASDVPS